MSDYNTLATSRHADQLRRRFGQIRRRLAGTPVRVRGGEFDGRIGTVAALITTPDARVVATVHLDLVTTNQWGRGARKVRLRLRMDEFEMVNGNG